MSGSSRREGSSLDGVAYGSLARHADLRGSFRELWRDSAMGAVVPDRFVQANLSTSAAGVLRGLHLHERQHDLWVVTEGRAHVALVDVRPMIRPADPAARPLVETRELHADDWVVIPPGVAHGFLALEPLQVVYLVTNEYDGSDELGFAWDDPLAAVPWPSLTVTPSGRPVLSDRDRSNPSLAELIERLGT
jgi:dTDP-4-dehydrorhamnose 3,5-epimerase